MSPELTGLLGLICLFVALTVGIPIGVSLGIVGFGGLMLLLSPEAAVIKTGVIFFEVISKYELGVLPLFLLLAHLCFSAGASRDFFDVAARFMGHRRGGLAVASIAGCAGFGAVSGSSLATVATVGSAAMPEMRKAGYQNQLATGSLAAGGTLGALIPPSGALIVFGIIAEQSIGTLFAAAIIPGITQAIFYIATVMILCTLNPSLGPRSPRVSWPHRIAGLKKIGDIALLILFVIGGMMIGLFTPSEAASVGVALTLVLCYFRGVLSLALFKEALRKTLLTSGMIYLIIIGAIIFGTFISVTGLATMLAEVIRSVDASPVVAIIVMAIILLALGSFLDGLALMLLTTPIFLPIILELGYSPIWFGIFLVRAMETGFILPPLGLNAYVLQGIVKDIPITTIFRGIVPFLVADVCHLSLIITLPALALWLPSVTGV
ncbi:TRAP transporter large permease [Alteromonas confluentis]|uniref:TRAP transporter large permease protein n=1 Tax=Alteromonas confluentis TaxID=1656094 RepID=A0A1E7ZCL1_9ALTE|nr:TRAP transporter large permease [Alteromonas confluentis]OFC71201.1 C4-dicarboxylate ABC transporter permease [Alteromonas confluentis]